MSMFRILALICCLAALAAILICALTNWNDELFPPLALGLSAAGNIFNLLCNRRDNGERTHAK